MKENLTLCMVDDVNLAFFTEAAQTRGLNVQCRFPKEGLPKGHDQPLIIDGDSWCAGPGELAKLVKKFLKKPPRPPVALFSYQLSDEDLSLLRKAGVLAYSRPALDELLWELVDVLKSRQPVPAEEVPAQAGLVPVV